MNVVQILQFWKEWLKTPLEAAIVLICRIFVGKILYCFALSDLIFIIGSKKVSAIFLSDLWDIWMNYRGKEVTDSCNSKVKMYWITQKR